MALTGYTREELELRLERLRREKKELQQKGGILATLQIAKINFDIDETVEELESLRIILQNIVDLDTSSFHHFSFEDGEITKKKNGE